MCLRLHFIHVFRDWCIRSSHMWEKSVYLSGIGIYWIIFNMFQFEFEIRSLQAGRDRVVVKIFVSKSVVWRRSAYVPYWSCRSWKLLFRIWSCGDVRIRKLWTFFVWMSMWDWHHISRTSENDNNITAENALHLHAGGGRLRLASVLDNIINTLYHTYS